MLHRHLYHLIVCSVQTLRLTIALQCVSQDFSCPRPGFRPVFALDPCWFRDFRWFYFDSQTGSSFQREYCPKVVHHWNAKAHINNQPVFNHIALITNAKKCCRQVKMLSCFTNDGGLFGLRYILWLTWSPFLSFQWLLLMSYLRFICNSSPLVAFYKYLNQNNAV